MAYLDSGRVGFVNKGDFDATVTYEKLDVVKFQNAIFCALKSSIGSLPSLAGDTQYWQLWFKLSDMKDESGTVFTPLGAIQFLNGTIVNDTQSGVTKITIGISETEWTAIQNILV